MKLSKEELLALGSALYLLGIELEAGRSKLEELVNRSEAAGEGFPNTAEVAEQVNAYRSMKDKFAKLEGRYLRLKEELS